MTQEELIEQKANEIAFNMVTKSGVPGIVAFDPMTIAMIIAAIKAIISILQGCEWFTPDIKKAARRYGPFERRKMEQAAKKALGNKYKELGQAVIYGTREVVLDTPDEDVKIMTGR